jgi:hypothetical protein
LAAARPVNLRNVARESAAFTEAQPQDESIVEVDGMRMPRMQQRGVETRIAISFIS